jgi:hypothetical protein
MTPHRRRILQAAINVAAVIPGAVMSFQLWWVWVIPVVSIAANTVIEYVYARRDERDLNARIEGLKFENESLKQTVTETAEVMPALQTVMRSAAGTKAAWFAGFRSAMQHKLLVKLAEQEQWYSGSILESVKGVPSDVGRILDDWIDQGVVRVVNAADHGGDWIRVMGPAPGYKSGLLLALAPDWRPKVKAILAEAL